MYNLSKKTPSVKKMSYINKLPTSKAFLMGYKLFLIWALPCVMCFALLVWIWRHL